LAADDLVTRACSFFEADTIDDFNSAPPIADQTFRLKLAGYQRHRGPLHAQHFGKEFLGQRKSIAVGSVSRLQQPTGQTLMSSVACVASRSEALHNAHNAGRPAALMRLKSGDKMRFVAVPFDPA
jgi:hypothetical protein